jgi:PAS domain S-box-containing protein
VALPTPPCAALDLDPRPESAGEGRRFVRLALRGWGCPDDIVDLTVLAAAELLSNAILHAGTPLRIEVGYRHDGVARVAVTDHSTTLPTRRAHPADSITGRGLGLVHTVSRTWGVEPSADGKVVWAEVDGSARHEAREGAAAPFGGDDVATATEATVRLPRLSVAGFVAMQAQHEAVLRELELTALEGPSREGSTDVLRIVELARRVAGPRDLVRRAVDAAERQELDEVDVVVQLTRSEVLALQEWTHAMVDADELCRSGALLSPPATPDVVAVRLQLMGYLDQYLRGQAPSSAGLSAGREAGTGPGPEGVPVPGAPSPEEYHQAFHLASVGMAITDLDGRFQAANRSLCLLLGRTEEDLRQHTLAEISEPAPPGSGAAEVARGRAPVIGGAVQVERRYTGPGAAPLWGRTTSRLLPGGADRDRVLVEVVDVTAAHLTGELRQNLARARLDLDRIVRAVTDAGVALSGAAIGAFYDLDGFETITSRYATSPGAAEALGPVPASGSGALLRQTLLSARTVRLDDVVGGARAGEEVPVVRSYLAVPVASASGAVIGAMVFGHPAAGRFEPRHERLLAGIAAEAAVTMDNARLYRAAQNERRAAEAAAGRLARLQAATARLSNVKTMDDVGTLLLGELTISVGAEFSALWALSPDGRTLDLVGDVNWRPDLLAKFARFRLDERTPAGEAIRSGRPVRIASLAERGRFAGLADIVTRVQLSYTFPLVIDGRPIGVLTFGWLDSRELDEENLRFITAVASQCAQALDRAVLYLAEQRAVHHQQFLAEASRALAGSLDLDATVAMAARLAVPELADTATVLVLEHDGVRPAAHAADPVKERLLEAVSARLGATDNNWLTHVARTGEAAIRRHFKQSDLDAAAVDDRHRRQLAALALRSLMAVPLVARRDTVGILVLTMTADSGRHFRRADVDLVRDLADRAAIAIDNARTFQLRSEVAETLQQSLLPPRLPSIPGTELASRYQPAAWDVGVGGDFYDAFETRGGWVLALGDVCGKGAPAAALTAMVRYSLRAAATEGGRPAAVLDRLNEAVLRQSDEERFCTVVYARLVATPHGVRVTVSAAGHPLPLVVRAQGAVTHLGGPGVPLGLFPRIQLTERTTELTAGDTLVLYSDGITEAQRDRELFGDERLVGVVRRHAGRPAEDIADAVVDAVKAFASAARRDDLALLVLRVPGGA